jgi:hypothetical protein
MFSFQLLWVFTLALTVASQGNPNALHGSGFSIAVAPLRCAAETLPVAPRSALLTHLPFARPVPAGQGPLLVERAEQALAARGLALVQDSSQEYPFGPVESGYGWGWTWWWWIVIAGIALFFVLIFAAWGGWSSGEEEPPPKERTENSHGKQR